MRDRKRVEVLTKAKKEHVCVMMNITSLSGMKNPTTLVICSIGNHTNVLYRGSSWRENSVHDSLKKRSPMQVTVYNIHTKQNTNTTERQ